MRIIATGWRGTDARYRPVIEAGLYRYRQTYEPSEVTLVHGAGTGVDQLAAELAREWGWTAEPHPARWAECDGSCPSRPHRRTRGRDEYCPLAGPRRNREMCVAGADVAVAFPALGSVGTWDLLHWATRYHIPFVGHPLATASSKGRAVR